MQELLKILRDLITPVTLLVIALVLRPYLAENNTINSTYLQNLPLVLLGLAMTLSWKFNRQQCFSLMLMAFAFSAISILAIEQTGQYEQFQTKLILGSFATFIPLNFIIFEIWKAPRHLSLARLGHFLIITTEIAVTYWLLDKEQTFIIPYLYISFLPPEILISDTMPQLALVLFSGAFIIQGIRVGLQQDAVDSAMLVSIVALFISVYFVMLTSIHFLIFSAMGIMICIAIIQESFNMAFIDPLTRLPSRRAMNDELKKLGRQYTIAMLDIDHFKKINDTYGHDVGDQVLRKLAKHLQRIGGGGHASRYGGEEFAVVFPGKNIIEVSHYLELLRANIAASGFTVRNVPRPKKIPKHKSKPTTPHKEIKVTVSIGIAERSRINRKAEDVQKAADEALYQAKKTGRNKICF